MRFLIVFYLLAIGIAALLAEMVLPVIFPVLSFVGFGSALVPLVVIYASLELGDERAPLLAGILGILVDLTSTDHLGTTVLILASLAGLIVTQSYRPESQSWLVRLSFVLVGTFAFLVMDYLLLLVETSRWVWPLAIWSKITFASLMNLIISPVVFFVIGLPPRLCGWKPLRDKEERLYAR